MKINEEDPEKYGYELNHQAVGNIDALIKQENSGLDNSLDRIDEIF